MQKDIFKKKSYIRPEAEAVWMDNEALLDGGASVNGHGQPWGAKRNNIGFMPDNEDCFDDESFVSDDWEENFDEYNY